MNSLHCANPNPLVHFFAHSSPLMAVFASGTEPLVIDVRHEPFYEIHWPKYPPNRRRFSRIKRIFREMRE